MANHVLWLILAVYAVIVLILARFGKRRDEQKSSFEQSKPSEYAGYYPRRVPRQMRNVGNLRVR